MFDKVIIYAPKLQLRLLRKEFLKDTFRVHNPGDDFNLFRKIKRKIFRNPYTHSYIFEGFFNAADFLGYKTFWIENQSDLEEISDSKTLVFCEGSYMPDFNKKINCKFALHSIPKNLDKFSELSESKNCLKLEVFKNEALNFLKIGDLTYFDQENFTLYQPWATNLIPYEIVVDKNMPNFDNKISYYIGMLYGKGVRRAKEYNLSLKNSTTPTKIKCVTGASHKTSQDLTINSSICLDIRDDHHLEVGYIPCRIFKTLSYGREIYVNSHYIKKYLSHIPFVKFFNNGESLKNQYNEKLSMPDYQKKALIEEKNFTLDFIKNHHTYVNRLENIFSVFN
tara:strand:+ start:814 stop:1824 length:1011 start_codon:yes stop_codon:yes gene_type:complete